MEINILPRWLLTRLGIAPESQIHWAHLLSSWLALAAPLLLIRIPHFCLFRKLLGIPCPGCGILHAMTSLLKMHIGEAWSSNPAAFFFAALLVFQLVARPVALTFSKTRPVIGQISHYGSQLVLGVLLFVWIDRLLLGGIHGFRHLS